MPLHNRIRPVSVEISQAPDLLDWKPLKAGSFLLDGIRHNCVDGTDNNVSEFDIEVLPCPCQFQSTYVRKKLIG